MKLIKKLSSNEIRTGYISLSQELLGNFYDLPYSREDIENSPNRRIRVEQIFHVPQLEEGIFNKRLELRIHGAGGGIVVELILNNIMQRLNLSDEDLLLIEQIDEYEYYLDYIIKADVLRYEQIYNLLNGRRYHVVVDGEFEEPIANLEI